MSDADRIAARTRHLEDKLRGAAQELLLRGALGVAVAIDAPALPQPLLLGWGRQALDGEIPLAPDAQFAIASQSKMLNAALVLLLAREGAFRIDEPVARYLPGVPAVDADATIEQFLNHTSGIGNFIHAMTVLPSPWPQFEYDDLIAFARMQGRQFAAGARLDYNNTDVVVLAKLCETVTGTPRAELLRRYLFEPLGMNRTQIGPVGAARMARGYYRPTHGGDAVDMATVPDYSIASAAGDIVSTLPDMLRFARSLFDPGSRIGLRLEDMASSVADVGTQRFSWFLPRTYGRGVECWTWGGRRAWGHRGSFFGYHSGTFVEPASRVAISSFLTMVTEGGFMRFVDLEAHDYQSFLETALHAAFDLQDQP